MMLVKKNQLNSEVEWDTISLDNKEIFEFQSGLWKGKKKPFTEAAILRNTNFTKHGSFDYSDVAVLPIEERFSESKKLLEGDIVIERSGGGPNQPVGRVAYFDRNDRTFYFSNFTSRLRVLNQDIIFPLFLHYYLYFFHITGETEKLQNRTTGIRNLSFNDYKKTKIPLPPLTEQKKIASVLSIIQEARETTEAVIEATRELKKSMMKHLFTYGPVPVSDAEKVPLKETEIGMVPEEWKNLTLDDIAYEYKNTVDPLEIVRCRYVGLEHIISGELTLNSFGFSDEVKSAKHSFTSGDILFGKLRPYLDKVAKADFEGICSTDILVIRNHENCLTDYLGYFMHSKGFLDQTIATMSGVNHPRTSWNKLKGLKIGLPSIENQKMIVEKLSVLDHKIHAETAKKEALEALFQSMLQKLMTGELRVTDLDIPINEINHG